MQLRGTIFFLLFLCSTLAFAAPSIFLISGNYEEGQSVVISGSGFGSKTQAAPLIWDDFEWGNDGTSLEDSGDWNVQGDECGYPAEISTDRPWDGTRSAKFEFKSACGANTWHNTCQQVTASDELYLNYRYYMTLDGAGINKLARLSSGSCYTGNPRMIVQAASNLNIYIDWFNGSYDQFYAGITSVATWHNFEMYFGLSDPPGTANGTAEFGKDYSYSGDYNRNTRDTGDSTQLDYVMIGESSTSPGSDYEVYIDNVYVDNTRQRVEIGNSQTYTSCTNREIQIPSAWATGEITITIRLGTIPDVYDENHYLFVVDADGTSSSGYGIHIVRFTQGVTIN